MVQLVLGMSERPRPDDAADALAIAAWVANTRPGRGDDGRRGVLDRAAVPPIRRGETGYERRPRGPAPSARSAPTSAARRARRDRAAVIASVEGVVGAVAPISLVIEVGGIGYRVFAAPSVLAAAQPGGRLKLHTYHLVREDQQALYGFRSAEELGFFTLLLTVNGVGPKVALAIVGSRPTADLQLAIMASDQAVLVAIPGIGKKLAERIIFELKEKVTAAGVSRGRAVGAGRRRERGRDRRRAPGARLLAGRGARGIARGAGRCRRRVDARGAGQGGAAQPAARLTRPARSRAGQQGPAVGSWRGVPGATGVGGRGRGESGG